MKTRHATPKTIQVRMDQFKQLAAIALQNAITTRSMDPTLGKSYQTTGGDGWKRDIYNALGWFKTVTFSQYMSRYRRQGVARRLIDAYPKATWRLHPQVLEAGYKGESPSPFEKKWNDVTLSLNVYHYIQRADKISGIGDYAVLLMGYNDGEDLSVPVDSASELLYLCPYSSETATITSWDNDTNSPRYGLPVEYGIAISNYQSLGLPTSTTRKKQVNRTKVHWTRVLHLAEDLLENDVLGIPWLEAVFNDLMSLELIIGSCGEMFWRGAFPGIVFNADADVDMKTVNLEALQEEIDTYLHDLRRYIRMQGVDVKTLNIQVADPSNHVSVILDEISAARGIPKRILIGSERGELASSQDERNWASRVQERQVNYAEPMVLRAFIDKLLNVGVLPAPENGYIIVWPPLSLPSDEERANIAQSRSTALAKYAETPGAEDLVPANIFLSDFLGLSHELVEQIEKARGGALAEEEMLVEEVEEAVTPTEEGTAS